MSNLNKQIKEYLKQDNPDYFKGLTLYSQHPKARRNVVMTCEKRFRHGTQQQKLIYELELCINAKKHSGKRAIIGEMPKTPFNIQTEAVIAAPQDFEYEVKYEDLPKDLQALAVEKGELYNELEVLKKGISALGNKNDDKSVTARKEKRDLMVEKSDRIKGIHAYLSKFTDKDLQAKIKNRDESLKKAEGIQKMFKETEKDYDLEAATKYADNNISINKLQEEGKELAGKDDEDSVKRLEDIPVEVKILEEENIELAKKFDKKIFDKREKANAELMILSTGSKELQEEIDAFKESFKLKPEDVKTPKEPKPIVWDEDTLNKEYKFEEMSWAERKLLLKKLQSLVPKQLERAQSSEKEKTRLKNAKEAIRGQAMLNILQKYFGENLEDPDKK